jgi:serralysin
MRSRFLSDLQNPSDGSFNAAWDDPIFLPAVTGSRAPPPSSTPLVFPTPAISEEAVQAQNAQSGSVTVVAQTSGGITFNLLFDAAAMAAPQSFRTAIQQAASLLGAAISDKITVNIKIDYSGTGGGAAAGPDNGQFESYSTIKADLINAASPGDTTFNALPAGSSFQGQTNIVVWNAQLKALGLLGANDTTTDDGSATFATDISPGLLVGVALHELTHALGRVPYGAPYGPQPDIFDFFRFTSAGARLISGGNTAPAAYFSVDGGNTKLADFGQNSDPSDFLNAPGSNLTPNDAFNEYYNSNTLQSLTTVDIKLLDALGFNTMAAAPVVRVIESFGSTSLTQVGSNFYLYNSSGTGPSLKYGGVLVVGQANAWAPISAEQIAGGGYEVAWHLPGSDQYSVWYTDSTGNFVSGIGIVSGSSYALESLESSFHQDLNGDGVIGVVGTVIEANGSTSLTEVGNNFYLLDSNGAGPSLKYGGVLVVGQANAWAPISAEQIAGGGYEVAWHLPGSDQYSVWYTDSTGNFVSGIGIVSGSSYALESLETSFHQDLNGDGHIGPVIGAGATLELPRAESGSVAFAGSTGTLKLDAPSTFTGQIVGFTGDGTMSGSDQIDLLNMTYSSSVQSDSTYNSTTDVLSVSNGSTIDLLNFVGSYSQANFKFASDGHGGTIVYDPPTTGQPISEDGTYDTAVHVTGTSTISGSSGLNASHLVVDSGATLTLENATTAGNTIINNGTVKVVDNSTVDIAAGAGQDNFVFAPNFGHATISNFTPGTDIIQIDHAAFKSMDALLAAAHDDSHGSVVITDATHDTITIQNCRHRATACASGRLSSRVKLQCLDHCGAAQDLLCNDLCRKRTSMHHRRCATGGNRSNAENSPSIGQDHLGSATVFALNFEFREDRSDDCLGCI